MFLIIILLFVGNTFVLFLNERKNIIDERRFLVNSASEKVSARVKGHERDLLDTLTTVLENYDGLWSDENGKKSFDKQKLKKLIVSKMAEANAPLYYFAKQKGDFTVFQGGEMEMIQEKLHVKDYIENNVDSLVTGTSEREWRFIEIDGHTYCFYCYYVSADIYVGIVQKPEALFDELYDLAINYNGLIEVRCENDPVFYYNNGNVKKSGFGVTGFEDIDLGFNMTADISFKLAAASYFRANIITVIILGFILCLILLLSGNRILKNKIIDPVEKMAEEVVGIDEINETTAVDADAEVAEIRQLENGINSLLSDVIYNRMEAYSAELRKKEQELSSLRSQIRPHFFLNAITTVNAMTYQGRNDDIRTYLMRLSDFMRYVINDKGDMVTLEEEVNNVKNYCQMQEIRFPGKALLFAGSPKEYKDILLPRCLLLTIVENSYKYAMGASDVMQIYIDFGRVERDDLKGVLITIEDNGPGFTEDQLSYYNGNNISKNNSEGHVGLLNVKETLRLTYKRDNLMTIGNTVPTGAEIKMIIPEEERDK